ncbi:DUF938 domain-containing protein [Roseobacter sp.]|uniref:DUF938 domain-containing protein n=1 Tax=Roseobacter sp. TaxID=1907202 RepID=UPI00385B3393
MTRNLPPNASVADAVDGAKLHAPAATRNARFLCDLLREYAPQTGTALEIASGTGQHIISFAEALPKVIWQPTDVDHDRLASIDAYVQDTDLASVRAASFLDATQPGWHQQHRGTDLIVLINLLHLITDTVANTVVIEAMHALPSAGKFILYGPFKRNGALTSSGDAGFDASLRAADPKIGYKDDVEILAWLNSAGASSIDKVEMPANNLAFVATKA